MLAQRLENTSNNPTCMKQFAIRATAKFEMLDFDIIMQGDEFVSSLQVQIVSRGWGRSGSGF